ncbi:MAG: hypothetical protein FWH45_01395 [Methanomassiliicoccaceae archaeon]|nr:hypothetical protein [Methanomassiliicoccaceae archaeon]MCL2145823.1 hypothetical protein [Methanomassiliicoccaceae archaeon]
MVSERKKTNMKYGAIIGAAVGVAIFALTYTLNPSWAYLMFIPLAAAMGWGIQYVKDENIDD